MSKDKFFENLKFDRRLVERYLQKGLFSEKEYQSYLKKLPELEGEYEEVSFDELLPKSLIDKLMGAEKKEAEEENEEK